VGKTYHIKVKKEYAVAVIEDLQKMDAVELIIENDDYEIPEWQQTIVRERMAAYHKNPQQASDFDAAMDDIENEL
jgi:hypothetical protein